MEHEMILLLDFSQMIPLQQALSGESKWTFI